MLTMQLADSLANKEMNANSYSNAATNQAQVISNRRVFVVGQNVVSLRVRFVLFALP